MDEARRFLRYIIPATGLALEFYVFAWILAPAWTEKLLTPLLVEPKLATVAAAVVSAGVVGHLLGMLHHNLAEWISDYRPLDYCDTIIRLRSVVDYVSVHDGTLCDATTIGKLSREQAWCVMNSLWYSRKDDTGIKGVDPRDQFLCDLMHSMGTARLGTYLGAVAALFIGISQREIAFDAESVGHVAVVATLASFLIRGYHATYRRTVRLAEGLAELALHDALAKEARTNKRRIVARVLVKGDLALPRGSGGSLWKLARTRVRRVFDVIKRFGLRRPD